MSSGASRGNGFRAGCVSCAALVLAAGGGCVGAPKLLPPRAPPDAVPPPVALPPTPPAENRARVVLYTTDGPMRILAEAPKQFAAAAADQPRSGELCVSPCVVDVPPGHYKLYLEGLQPGASGDADDLQVSPGLNYYLRAPGHFEHPTWLAWSSGLVAVAGILAVTAGLAWAATSGDSGHSPTPGLAVFGAGVGILIGAGVYTYDAQRGTIQPGATTQWLVPLQ